MPANPDLPVRQPSLADQVCEIILKGINDGSYSPGSLLPSENQLAERYNVSRSTIRAAFARLVEQGYVKRTRGVGTFVTESEAVLNSKYHQLGIYDRISSQGFEPGILQHKTAIVEVGSVLAKIFSIEAKDSALLVEKVFTADGKPVIWFMGYIPYNLFEESLSLEQVLKPEHTEAFYKFFSRYCKNSVKYLTSTIYPDIAENVRFPGVFDPMEPNTPILVIESVGYGENDSPLFFSREYIVGGEGTFHIIRYADGFA